MGSRPPNSLLRYIRRLSTVENDKQAPDSELLRRYALFQDEQAFATIVRRHGNMVHRVCQRVLGNAADADDAFQATFIVLMHKAGSVRWKISIANWLYGVAYRVCLESRKKERRRKRYESNAKEMSPADSLSEITLREAQQMLDNELACLAEKYQAPLVLCYLKGATRDEAARQLGWSLATLKRRLERGRKLLHQRLARRGLTLPAAFLATAIAASSTSASVSPELVAAVLSNVTLYAGSVGMTSAKSALLAKGLLHSTWLVRYKAVLPVLLAAAVLGTTVGWTAHTSFTRQPCEQGIATSIAQNPNDRDVVRESHNLLDRAWQIVDRLPPSAEKVYLLTHIARSKGRTTNDVAPLFEHALQVVGQLGGTPEAWQQDRLRYCLATNEAECGQIDTARDTCALIRNHATRAEALVQVIHEQAQRNDWSGAFETIRAVQACSAGPDTQLQCPGGERRRAADGYVDEARAAIAQWQARKGRCLEARKTVDGIADARSRAFALAKLARVEAAVGMETESYATASAAVQSAIPIFNPNNEPQGDSELRLRLAGALLAVGHFDEACQMACGLTGSAQVGFLSEVALAQMARGDTAEAQRTADQLAGVEPIARAQLWRRLAVIQARNQDWSGALRTAERVQDPVLELYARMAIGWIQGESGDRTGAARILADCWHRMRDLPHDHPVYKDARNNAWYNLAQIQAGFGNESEMLNRAADLGRPLLEVRVWLGVAEGLAMRTAPSRQSTRRTFPEAAD
jgi:RNA polymerase sigma factor (sigma-70 family)